MDTGKRTERPGQGRTRAGATDTATRTAYHHGDARNALIASATALLERQGAANLSLRGVAEAAGLSRQAPYNHFASKEALLAELAAAGFRQLTEAVAAIERIDARRALADAGHAYIKFAHDHPALFGLMFSRERVALARHPVMRAAADDSYRALAEVVALQAAPDELADLTLAAWSIVHGYATLCIEMDLEPESCFKARGELFAALITGRD